MKTQSKKILAGLAALITAAFTAHAQYTFTELSDPVSVGSSQLFGISGGNIVGWSGAGGFLFNGGTWTNFDPPSAASGRTLATAIDAYNIVGYFNETNGNTDGFLYNLVSSNWTILKDPAAAPGAGGGTYAFGISGAVISGYYGDANGDNHGFIYNIADGTWTNRLDDPGAASGNGLGTSFCGISGIIISGYYFDSRGTPHGLLYNLASGDWTSLDAPLGAEGTYAYGISGSKIVGNYYDNNNNSHGFLYSMISSNWTALNEPAAPMGYYPSGGTFCIGISGEDIVGYYFNGIGTYGFLATPIPQLTITQSGNNLNFSWPYWNNPSLGWILQQNSDLTTINWTAAPTNAISNDGTNNNFITITPSAGNLFFRLSQQ
jgi:hypothetical protein